jgi:hypothetical protein
MFEQNKFDGLVTEEVKMDTGAALSSVSGSDRAVDRATPTIQARATLDDLARAEYSNNTGKAVRTNCTLEHPDAQTGETLADLDNVATYCGAGKNKPNIKCYNSAVTTPSRKIKTAKRKLKGKPDGFVQEKILKF